MCDYYVWVDVVDGYVFNDLIFGFSGGLVWELDELMG